MIKIAQSGDFSNLKKFLSSSSEILDKDIFDQYGEMGVEALMQATPIDTGKTARSWSYKVVRDKTRTTIEFHNSNINNGVNVALILQLGHATKNGGWVEGIDYINPALSSVFGQMADDLFREVTGK